MKRTCLYQGTIFLILSFLIWESAFALTTEEIIRLKKSGIPEETIVLMVEKGYGDVDKVLSLKNAGFRDENIKAIINAEAHGNSPGETITLRTPARINIRWYLVYRGKPVLQNSQAIDNALLSLVDNASVKLEWKEQEGLGLLEAFRKKPFKSPFYWTINPGKDSLTTGAEGYAYILQSGINHQGKPDTDGEHYWVLYFDPKDANIADAIRKAL